MERRRFIEKCLWGIGLGSLLVIGGCGKSEKSTGFGNEGNLWQLAIGAAKVEEPIESAHSKNTPALYRDASMGKADPSFVPKVAGG